MNRTRNFRIFFSNRYKLWWTSTQLIKAILKSNYCGMDFFVFKKKKRMLWRCVDPNVVDTYVWGNCQCGILSCCYKESIYFFFERKTYFDQFWDGGDCCILLNFSVAVYLDGKMFKNSVFLINKFSRLFPYWIQKLNWMG